jgi:hypothetical protein
MANRVLDSSSVEVAAASSAAFRGSRAAGITRGGWRVVGENGPELEYTGASRIYSSAQSRAAIGGGNAAALEARLNEVVAELRQLRAESASGTMTVARYTKRTSDNIERVTRGGEVMVTTPA